MDECGAERAWHVGAEAPDAARRGRGRAEAPDAAGTHLDIEALDAAVTGAVELSSSRCGGGGWRGKGLTCMPLYRMQRLSP